MAWIRLKVVGVNISFFLPRRVVCRTSGEEFHSLKATAYPCERSQWLSSEIWVRFARPVDALDDNQLAPVAVGNEQGHGRIPNCTVRKLQIGYSLAGME